MVGQPSRAINQAKDFLKSGRQLDVVTATKLAKACGKAQDWEVAICIFDSLQSFRLADAILRGAVVSACASGAAWEATLELLKGGVDVVACSSAITACERGQQWEKAIELLKEMWEQRVQPNVITYNAAMSACEKGDSWQSAFSLFAEMVNLNISHSVVSYGAAIAACRRASDWERALDLVWKLDAPNHVIYSSAMEALLEAERWQLALVLWKHAQAMGRRPDAALMSSAMSAWAQGGSWSEALILLQQLRGLSMADGMAYTNAINSCEASGHWELALSFLQTAGPSLVSSSCALAVFATAAVWQMALQLLEDSPALCRDAVACGTALRACGRVGRWPEALQLVKQAEGNRITGTILCNAAITACDVCAQWQRAIALLAHMREGRIPEDSITIGAAMSACEKGKQWVRALALFAEMKVMLDEQGLRGSAVAFTSALTALGGQWQRALPLLEEMRHDEIFPNDVTYTTVVSACGRAVRWEVSLWLLQKDMLQNEIEPGVLAISLAVSAIEQGSNSPVAQAALATLLQDLSEKGMVRSQELRLAAVQKKVPQSATIVVKHLLQHVKFNL